MRQPELCTNKRHYTRKRKEELVTRERQMILQVTGEGLTIPWETWVKTQPRGLDNKLKALSWMTVHQSW